MRARRLRDVIRMVSLSFRSAALLALLLLAVAAPALAHNATELGVAPDQFDKGIPVYWPYHATTMSVGLVLLLSGAIVMRYHRTHRWFQNHRRLQAVGGLAAVLGLSVGLYMINLSAAPHLHGVHDILGAGTIAVIFGTLGLGVVMTRPHGASKRTRRVHHLMGWAAIGLVTANIALGLAMLPSVLAQ
jgi:hypothetical protein